MLRRGPTWERERESISPRFPRIRSELYHNTTELQRKVGVNAAGLSRDPAISTTSKMTGKYTNEVNEAIPEARDTVADKFRQTGVVLRFTANNPSEVR